MTSGIAIGRDDEPATGRMRASAPASGSSTVPAPMRQVGSVSRCQRGNARERIGRVEWDFDDPNTRGKQHACDLDDPCGLDAAQDRNDRGFCRLLIQFA